MFPIISYTIHITASICFALLLVFYKGDSKQDSITTYYKYMRYMAAMFMTNVPVDVVLLYCYIKGVTNEFLFEFLLPVMGFLFIGLLFKVLHLRLHTTYKRMRWHDLSVSLYLVSFLLHPLFYSQYRLQQGLPLSVDSYIAFLKTPLSTFHMYITYALGAIFVLVCIVNTIVFVRRYYFLDREFISSVGTRLVYICIFVLVIFCPCLEFLIGMTDIPYYFDLPFWSFVIAVVSIVQINTKERYICLEQKALSFELAMEDMKYRKRKPSTDLSPDESTLRREYAIVSRAINEWLSREDHPYLAKNLTLTTFATELGLPEGVVSSYLNKVYRLYFNEFIAFHAKQYQSASSKESVMD